MESTQIYQFLRIEEGIINLKGNEYDEAKDYLEFTKAKK